MTQAYWQGKGSINCRAIFSLRPVKLPLDWLKSNLLHLSIKPTRGPIDLWSRWWSLEWLDPAFQIISALFKFLIGNGRAKLYEMISLSSIIRTILLAVDDAWYGLPFGVHFLVSKVLAIETCFPDSLSWWAFFLPLLWLFNEVIHQALW